MHEIDRRIYMVRLHRAGITFVVIPGLGVVWGLIFHEVLELGMPSVPTLIGGSLGLIAVVATMVHSFRNARQQIAALEDERCWLAARVGESHEEGASIDPE